MDILVTCPPILRSMEAARPLFEAEGFRVHGPETVHALSEEELIRLTPRFDAWVIGDDPATRAVLEAGRNGRLKAAVRYGVGMDNVDLAAAESLGLRIRNTPGMLGREVADVAMSYVVALARHTFWVDRQVRDGRWPKPVGISLAGRRAAVVGFGDVGHHLATRLLAAEMKVLVYDPKFQPTSELGSAEWAEWPDRLGEADFIVLTCPLVPETQHLIRHSTLEQCHEGVRIVNVSRGGLIDEDALAEALESGRVHSAALEVMEDEPLPSDSPLRRFDQCLFGSHNAGNTIDAVVRTTQRVIELLIEELGDDRLDRSDGEGSHEPRSEH